MISELLCIRNQVWLSSERPLWSPVLAANKKRRTEFNWHSCWWASGDPLPHSFMWLIGRPQVLASYRPAIRLLSHGCSIGESTRWQQASPQTSEQESGRRVEDRSQSPMTLVVFPLLEVIPWDQPAYEGKGSQRGVNTGRWEPWRAIAEAALMHCHDLPLLEQLLLEAGTLFIYLGVSATQPIVWDVLGTHRVVE